MACVAPKINSVVIKMNKPSTGFLKRHSLAGAVNGNWFIMTDDAGLKDKFTIFPTLS